VPSFDLLNVGPRNAVVQVASGEGGSAARRGAVEDVNLDLCRSVRVVMSRGRRVSARGLRLGLEGEGVNAARENGG